MSPTRRARTLALASVWVIASASTASATGLAAATDPPRVRLVKVAEVDTPTAMATRVGDDTIYVAEQAGRVVAVRPDTGAVEPVLDLRSRITAGGEQGLLGLTFSPDGTRLFVHFTNRDGNTRVEAYDASASTPAAGVPVTFDPASRAEPQRRSARVRARRLALPRARGRRRRRRRGRRPRTGRQRPVAGHAARQDRARRP